MGVLACTLAALLLGPAPGAKYMDTVVQDDAVFLHSSPAQVRAAAEQLKALGATYLRVTAGWSVIAPQPTAKRRPGAPFAPADPATYDRGFTALDEAVKAATIAGLKVEIDIGFWAPRWAVARAVAPADRQRWGIDPQEFARFAAAVARRYSGRDRGLPAAVGFTIWNEPNYDVFLLPQWRRTAGRGWAVASADEYRAMLYAAVPAVRRAAPGALVLVGATAPKGAARPRSVADGVDPLRFLRALACVDGALRPMRGGACAGFRSLPGDGWAHHPYSPRVAPERGDPDPDTANVADLGRLTGLLDALARRGRTERALGVWVTEFGYETNPPDPTQPVTLAEQARWLSQAEARALATPGVRSFAQFLLRDLGPGPGRSARQRWADFQSGLELPNGAPKPAMAAFAYPLVARQAGPDTVAVWGRIRPGSGPRHIRIAAAAGPRAWAPVGRPLTTAADGTFALTVAADPAVVLRLELRAERGWRPVGVPVRAG
jgi:Cellulase (glycosyl hydrolase family 5)